MGFCDVSISRCEGQTTDDIAGLEDLIVRVSIDVTATG
jgi:hypothetical protein